MIKVFLVEDEVIVRNGIKNRIEWEANGFEFVGEASDGELAYPMIQKTKPDIIITDIRMPFMDGLELSRLVKTEMPKVKIVILSGYDEFDYAKEAIGIGVTDYLLKPVDAAEILRTLESIKIMIQEEREKEASLEQFQKEMEEDRNTKKKKLFREIIENNASYSEIIQKGKEIQKDLIGERYNLLLLQLFDKEEAYYSKTIMQVAERLDTLLIHDKEIIAIERGIDSWVFLIVASEKEQMEVEENYCKNTVINCLEEFPMVEYFGVIGESVARLGEVKHCLEKANKSFAYRYLAEKNQIVNCTEERSYDSSKEKIDLNRVDINKVNRKAIERFLRSGKEEEVEEFVEDLWKSIGESNIKSLLLRQYIVIDVRFAVQDFLKQINGKLREDDDFAECLSTLEKTRIFMEDLLIYAINEREALSKKKYHSVIDEAQQYIRDNFSNEDISLNTVAAQVNISPSHFSTIFSQETGQNFVEFLTEVRMEKAKELLVYSDMKCSSVAFEVGYKDSHYFTYLFKKIQGVTPSSYRANKGNQPC